jgi:hypothetical protein
VRSLTSFDLPRFGESIIMHKAGALLNFMHGQIDEGVRVNPDIGWHRFGGT